MKNQKIIVLQVDLADDPTKIKDYIDYHSNVWPEVIQDLKDRPIGRMRIYNVSNRLVMLLEVDQNFKLEDGIHIEPPRTKVEEWSETMFPLLRKLESGEFDTWKEMNKVFDTSNYF